MLQVLSEVKHVPRVPTNTDLIEQCPKDKGGDDTEHETGRGQLTVTAEERA